MLATSLDHNLRPCPVLHCSSSVATSHGRGRIHDRGSDMATRRLRIDWRRRAAEWRERARRATSPAWAALARDWAAICDGMAR